VLQADGGTRTASITGGYVALALAVSRLLADGVLQENPLRHAVAAVSAGIINGEVVLDLDYVEDSSADMDCNIVQNAAGGFVEVQSTAEGATASRDQLDELIDVASAGIRQLLALQQDAVSAR
jgi:ribonuclease PH